MNANHNVTGHGAAGEASGASSLRGGDIVPKPKVTGPAVVAVLGQAASGVGATDQVFVSSNSKVESCILNENMHPPDVFSHFKVQAQAQNRKGCKGNKVNRDCPEEARKLSYTGTGTRHLHAGGLGKNKDESTSTLDDAESVTDDPIDDLGGFLDKTQMELDLEDMDTSTKPADLTVVEPEVSCTSKEPRDDIDMDTSTKPAEVLSTSKEPRDVIIDPKAGEGDKTDDYVLVQSRKRQNGSDIRRKKHMRREAEEKESEKEKEVPNPEKMLRKEVEATYNVKNKSYSQAAKSEDVVAMLEARSSLDSVLLGQDDFNEIEMKCTYSFCMDEKESESYEFDLKGGKSQGGIWMACRNKGTEDLVRRLVPTLTPPGSTPEKPFKYILYGEHEKPFKYLQCRLPGKFWPQRENLYVFITKLNKWLTAPLQDGSKPHFRISAGLDKMKAMEKGFFEISLEVDERLFPRIAEKDGQIRMGMSDIKLYGSGMVLMAKKVIEDRIRARLDHEA